MEHEIEIVIREKVNAAELTTAVWNKERVWQNIPFQHENKRPVLMIYRAAACLLLLAMVLLYLFPVHQRQFDERTATREKAINQKLKEENRKSLKSLHPLAKVITCPTEKRVPSVVKTEKRTYPFAQKNQQPDLMVLKTEVAETAPPLPVSDLQVFSQSEEDKQIATSDPPKIIKAIVGIIPSPEQPDVRSKKKKLKFEVKLAPDHNSVTAPTEENKSLTARLN
jgi:hypothetical protein